MPREPAKWKWAMSSKKREAVEKGVAKYEITTSIHTVSILK